MGLKELLGLSVTAESSSLGEMDWLDELIIAVHLVDQNLHTACIHEFNCEMCMAARERRRHFVERTMPALLRVPKTRYQQALDRWLASDDYRQHAQWRDDQVRKTAHLWIGESTVGVELDRAIGPEKEDGERA